jgi:hypothetical protein
MEQVSSADMPKSPAQASQAKRMSCAGSGSALLPRHVNMNTRQILVSTQHLGHEMHDTHLLTMAGAA